MAEDHYLDRTRFRSDRCGRGHAAAHIPARLVEADPGDFICRPARGLQASFVQHLTLFPGRLGWYFIPMIVLGALISFVTRNLVAMFCFLAAVGLSLRIRRRSWESTTSCRSHSGSSRPTVAASWLAQWLTFVRAPARLLPFTAAGAAVFVLSIVPGLQGRPLYRTLRPEVRDLSAAPGQLRIPAPSS